MVFLQIEMARCFLSEQRKDLHKLKFWYYRKIMNENLPH